MYSQERELKKLRYTLRNKARVEGYIAEAFGCKEITNFSSMYFSRANNVNAPTTQCHVVRDVLLTELPIFQWKGIDVGLQVHIMSWIWSGTIPCFICTRTWWKSNHILESLTKTYWTSHVQPTLKQLDHMHEHGLKGGPSFLK
jgi:hypothetical protein